MQILLLVRDKAIEKEGGILFRLPPKYNKRQILKDALNDTIEGGMKDAGVYYLNRADKRMYEHRMNQL